MKRAFRHTQMVELQRRSTEPRLREGIGRVAVYIQVNGTEWCADTYYRTDLKTGLKKSLLEVMEAFKSLEEK